MCLTYIYYLHILVLVNRCGKPAAREREQERVNDMKIIEAKQAEATPNPHGVRTSRIYDSEHAQAVHILLKPGESLKKHITPVDVFFYVLEGEGVIEIGEERETVGPDTLIESPAKIPHRWLNESDADFRVLVVKVPRPTEKTRVL
jgi:mannose-6-phosphate isomerase-like protein (cupin superfamily)